MMTADGRDVLIVEPDRVIAQIYAEFLRFQGGRVRVVSSAQGAIMAVDHRLPDVIVLEPMMARHNGVEFLYELRSYQEWEGIPVVILSWQRASEYGGMVALGAQYGVAAFLSKHDTTLSVLAQTIGNCCETFSSAAVSRAV